MEALPESMIISSIVSMPHQKLSSGGVSMVDGAGNMMRTEELYQTEIDCWLSSHLMPACAPRDHPSQASFKQVERACTGMSWHRRGPGSITDKSKVVIIVIAAQ